MHIQGGFMISTLSDIVSNIVNFFSKLTNLINLDMLFVIALVVEALIVIFFLVKSAFSYEASLNRALDKINFWLFEKKFVTEENIKDLNLFFKTKAPKRLCYFWQQYILFREGTPSSYLSTENLIDKPLKTSSYNSNIKNLSLFSIIWAFVCSMFIIVSESLDANVLTGSSVVIALFVGIVVWLIGLVFMVYLRARKNTILNSLYQSVALFGRFMDNACIDLPSYIDYQILFTPQEIEKGQPVLREFLDYKARKEKEEFKKAKEENIDFETYDFSSTGIDGSIVLDRAMRESELYLKKKEKVLVKVSQIEAELESRRKNFDNVQKDSQTKIQASKENIVRLRQMQEETTNRIESNYYRKQQTQEVAKQEQLEQEFEQLRAKYLLEKNEGEEEIKKLNEELEKYREEVEASMVGEYQTFFDKFCQSTEKVVAKAFASKFESMKQEIERDKQQINELQLQLKKIPKGVYDAEADKHEKEAVVALDETQDQTSVEGVYDEEGNYVYPNGTFYDKEGNFHDENGNVYSQDGKLISEKVVEKQVVNFDDFDSFDLISDQSQKANIYDIAENIIEKLDDDNNIEIVNNEKPDIQIQDNLEEVEEEFPISSNVEETQPIVVEKKKAGRPKKIVVEEVVQKPAGKRGRPRKNTTETATVEKKKVGRPKKEVSDNDTRRVGRPKKIVKANAVETEKRGRGRPKKQSPISEINRKLSEEEARINETRKSLNKELESAVKDLNGDSEKHLRREQILQEIDLLQKEAQNVFGEENSEVKVSEINNKLESLLDEIKKLNQ